MILHRHITKHQQLIKYAAIGMTGATIDLALYFVLYRYVGITPFIATFLSVSAGIINNFFLNRHYNFKTKDHTVVRLISFYAVGFMGAVLSAALIWLLHDINSIDALLSKILTIIPIVLLQFFINKHVSFAEKPKKIYADTYAFVRENILSILVLFFVLIMFVVSSFHLITLDDTDNMLSGKLILEGLVPYRDFFSHHSPGMYYISALLYPLSDNNLFIFRLLFNLLLFAIACSSFAVIRKRVNSTTAIVYMILVGCAHTIGMAHVPLAESVLALLLPMIGVLTFFPSSQKTIPSTKEFTLLSGLLFAVPFMSLVYILPILPIYGVLLARLFLNSKKRDRLMAMVRAAAIFAAPYALFIAFFGIQGSLQNMNYDIFTFNSTYYAPMVGEQGGGALKTIAAILLSSIGQISLVAKNILNVSFLPQILLLFVFATAIGHLWRSHHRIDSFALLCILLLANSRTNIFNTPAIASSPEELAQHASVYIGLSLLCGAIVTVRVIMSKSAPRFMKYVSVLFLITVPSTMIHKSIVDYQAIFISKGNTNYYRYATDLKSNNIATPINRLLTKSDSAWIAPADFSAYLYLEPRRATSYTFYLPWLDASPRIRSQLIAQLRAEKPAVIYLRETPGGYKYSDEVKSFILENYFTVSDSRLAGYNFASDQRQKLMTSLERNHYETGY